MNRPARHVHRTEQVDPAHVHAATQITGLAASGQVERSHRWTTWEWIRWGLPFLLAGCAIGVVAVAIVNRLIP